MNGTIWNNRFCEFIILYPVCFLYLLDTWYVVSITLYKYLCDPINKIIDRIDASAIIISVNLIMANADANIMKLKNSPTPMNNAICTKNTLYGMFMQSFLTFWISSYSIFSFR